MLAKILVAGDDRLASFVEFRPAPGKVENVRVDLADALQVVVDDVGSSVDRVRSFVRSAFERIGSLDRTRDPPDGGPRADVFPFDLALAVERLQPFQYRSPSDGKLFGDLGDGRDRVVDGGDRLDDVVVGYVHLGSHERTGGA